MCLQFESYPTLDVATSLSTCTYHRPPVLLHALQSIPITYRNNQHKAHGTARSLAMMITNQHKETSSLRGFVMHPCPPCAHPKDAKSAACKMPVANPKSYK